MLLDDFTFQFAECAMLLFQIEQKVSDIIKHLQIIQENTKNLQNAITISVNAHSLNDVINALARSKGRTYDKNGDLILIKKVGEHEIRMNLSSAVRIYQKGLQIMKEKEAVLHKMKQCYFDEYVEDFEIQKRKLMKKIEDMEQNPWAYQHLLGHFTYDAEQVYVLRHIDVHESIPPLDPMIPHILEAMFSYYELEISKGKELITTIKKSFEEFFEQDQNVSKIFDLRY
jgi:exonuclease VII small subunit